MLLDYYCHYDNIVDADFLKNDVRLLRIGKLQEVLYYIEEDNFEESLDKIGKIDLPANDIVRNIIRISLCYKLRLPLFVLLVSELQKFKNDIVSQFESLLAFSYKIQALQIYYSLIEAGVLDISLKPKLENYSFLLKMLPTIYLKKEIYEESEKYRKMIEEDDIEVLKELCLSPDFDVNHIYEFFVSICTPYFNLEITLIELAAYYGSISCFRFLFINGAGLIRKPSRNPRIIELAIAGGNTDIIQMLEQAHCSPDKECISMAISFHRVEIFDWLVELYSDLINDEFSLSQALLDEFIHGVLVMKKVRQYLGFDAACQGGNTSIVRLFLSKFFSISISQDTNGLCNACRFGNLEIVKILVSNPSTDVNMRGAHDTPLVAACSSGNAEIVKLLLSSPYIDINKFSEI